MLLHKADNRGPDYTTSCYGTSQNKSPPLYEGQNFMIVYISQHFPPQTQAMKAQRWTSTLPLTSARDESGRSGSRSIHLTPGQETPY